MEHDAIEKESYGARAWNHQMFTDGLCGGSGFYIRDPCEYLQKMCHCSREVSRLHVNTQLSESNRLIKRRTLQKRRTCINVDRRQSSVICSLDRKINELYLGVQLERCEHPAFLRKRYKNSRLEKRWDLRNESGIATFALERMLEF